jgi:hypothetical protein
MLEHRLLVLGVVVLGVLADVPELAGNADAIRDLPPSVGREILDLVLQLLVTLWSEDHFLHDRPPQCLKKNARADTSALAGAA